MRRKPISKQPCHGIFAHPWTGGWTGVLSASSMISLALLIPILENTALHLRRQFLQIHPINISREAVYVKGGMFVSPFRHPDERELRFNNESNHLYDFLLAAAVEREKMECQPLKLVDDKSLKRLVRRYARRCIAPSRSTNESGLDTGMVPHATRYGRVSVRSHNFMRANGRKNERTSKHMCCSNRNGTTDVAPLAFLLCRGSRPSRFFLRKYVGLLRRSHVLLVSKALVGPADNFCGRGRHRAPQPFRLLVLYPVEKSHDASFALYVVIIPTDQGETTHEVARCIMPSTTNGANSKARGKPHHEHTSRLQSCLGNATLKGFLPKPKKERFEPP